MYFRPEMKVFVKETEGFGKQAYEVYALDEQLRRPLETSTTERETCALLCDDGNKFVWVPLQNLGSKAF